MAHHGHNHGTPGPFNTQGGSSYGGGGGGGGHSGHSGHHSGHGGHGMVLLGLWAVVSAFPGLSRFLTLFVILWLLK